jgi:hypothetical protein
MCRYSSLAVGQRTPLVFSAGRTVRCFRCDEKYFPGESLDTIHEGHRNSEIMGVVDVFLLAERSICPACQYGVIAFWFPCDSKS